MAGMRQLHRIGLRPESRLERKRAIAGKKKQARESVRPHGIARRVMNIPASLLRGFILVYRYSLSALMGRQCRFVPTCSVYADEAIGRHGALKGGKLALKRVCRCHPWGGSGYDPVP